MTGISSQSELSCIKARENVTPWRKKKKKKKKKGKTFTNQKEKPDEEDSEET